MKNHRSVLAILGTLLLLASCLCVADGATTPVVAGRSMGPLGRGNRSTNSIGRAGRRAKKSPNNIKPTQQQHKNNSANRNTRKLRGFKVDDVSIVTEAPRQLTNSEFESTNTKGAATGWSPYMGGYTVSTAESMSGHQSIAVKSGGAVQKLYPTNAHEGRNLKISGYAKSVGVAPIHHGPAVMSVYADIKFVDGSWLRGQEAEFAGGTTEGWEYAENTIPLHKDVEAVHLYAVYYGDRGDGVAYFDDFSLEII